MNFEVRHLHTFQDHSAAIYCICPGRTHDTIFSASGDKIVAEWNVVTHQQTGFAVRLDNPAYAVLYIPHHQLLCIGTSTGSLHWIDTSSRQELKHFTQHRLGIYDLLYDAQQDLLYAIGGDGVLSIWNVTSQKMVRAIPISEEKLRQLAMKDNRLLVAGNDGNVRVFEMAFFNEVLTLKAHASGVSSLAFHPTKEVMITGGKDALLKIWKWSDHPELLLEIPAHQFAIYSIVFSPSGKTMVTTSRDKTIKVWNAQTLEVLLRIDHTLNGHTHSVNRALFIGQHLVTCGDDRKITIHQSEHF